MPLETATYVPDLVVTNPVHGDQVQQSDSHLRLIKSALKATFPNFTSAALSATQAAIDAAVSTVTGLANHLFPLGSAATPSITPIGDTDTGIYSAGANKIDIATAGVKAVEVDASQNVAMSAALAVAGALNVTGKIAGPGTVPIGIVHEWYDDTLPDAAYGDYAWANGQVIANADTRCPVLLARWGSKFGGNGINTMGVPDRREATAYGKSTMGSTTSPGRITNYTLTTIGVFIGLCNKVLTQAHLPNITLATTIAAGQGSHGHVLATGGAFLSGNNGSGQFQSGGVFGSSALNDASLPAMSGTTPTGGSGTAVDTVTNGIVCNFVVRLA